MSNKTPHWLVTDPKKRPYSAIIESIARQRRADKRGGNSPSIKIPRHYVPARLAHALHGESLIQIVLILWRAGLPLPVAEKVGKNLKRITNNNRNR